MRRPIVFSLLLFLFSAIGVQAQDTIRVSDTVFRFFRDTVTVRMVDSSAIRLLEEKIKLYEEKNQFYQSIMSKNGVDMNKIEADRDRYRHLVDSLRTLVHAAELENVRKDEANKYLEQRAREAEGKVSEATNRKKKVRAIQGMALRFYRTPDWEIRLQAAATEGKYDKVVRNRNAGNIEFDYVTGASVMLWDLTQYFNKDHVKPLGDSGKKLPDIRRFDQNFAYDLGIYVGFGGSNLFKNFYIGPSFRFVDFFYLTLGVNVAEYEVLVSGYGDGDKIGASQTIDDVTAKAWLMKPFVSLSIDLDFLSYIKK